jgi:putative ABC transport system permease protein
MYRLFHALRLLRKNPGFAALVIVILALGIGANTVIFTIVDTVLLRPLPYRDSSRIVMLWQTIPSKGLGQIPVSQADFADYRDSAQSLGQMGFMYIDKENFSLTGLGDPQQVSGLAISANLFSMLGVAPAHGRGFLPNEDKAGNELKVLIGNTFWQRHFAGDPAAVGKSLTLDGKSYTIVGVMPPGFEFPPPVTLSLGSLSGGRELWIPQVLNRANRDYHPLGVFARLKPGATVNQAQSEITAIAARLSREFPKSEKGVSAVVFPFLELVVRGARPALLTLLAGVGCVLLIACVNIANLLLSRSTLRRKELAVRAALGANRRELIKQMLTENMLLALLGGIAGVPLASWSVNLVRWLPDIGVPRLGEVRIDWRLLAFATVLSLLTGALIGLIPALLASRVALNDSLKDTGRGLTGARHNRLRNFLAIAEISLALMLLVAAGLLVRSFDRILSVAPGFQPKNVFTADIRVPRVRYNNAPLIAAFQTELLNRVAALPGVISAATVNSLPIVGFQGATLFRIEGRLAPQQISDTPVASQRVVSRGYFATMGIPILRGRDFASLERPDSRKVIVVSQGLASRYFPNEDPIGKRMQVDNPQNPWLTIVGVVGDVHQFGLAADPGMTMYVPYTQDAWTVMSLVIRMQSNPESLAAVIRKEVAAIDRDQPVANITTLEKIVAGSVADRRFQLIALGVFSAVALMLALIGIYGVLSYSVFRRTNEIAIRMALGAQQADVLRRILAQGMVLAAAGIGVGLIGALALTRAMASLLFEIRPADPLTLTTVSAVVLITAVAAAYVPALRATRIDPITALRDLF